MNKICYIGIDPAFRDSGFAICIVDENNEVSFRRFKNGFMDFIGWLLHDRPDNCKIAIENSNLQNKSWNYNNRDSLQVKLKKSRDVGKNQAASQYTVDLCCEIIGKKNVFSISPKQKGKKIVNDTFFRSIVKQNKDVLPSSYKGLKNQQDERDAYMIMELGRRLSKRSYR